MGLSTDDQFQKILSSSEHLLIVLPENPSGDMIGAGYGLAHIADTLNIVVTIAFRNTKSDKEMYDFLPAPERIVHKLTGTRDFILTFKTKRNDITHVTSERTDDEVRIHVTPENGMIDSRDFSFGLAPFPFSTLITIGASDKESLGSILTEIPDIFYDVPIINIDNKSDNENFGQLNIVTLTASSLSEIVAALAEKWVPDHITKNAAQCLLTGIIDATDSFRSSKTTPSALSLAGNLMSKGADQHAIVTALYKSQPLSLLKLWGRTLSKLEVEEGGRIVSTCISQSDFDETETNEHFLPQIIDKIKKNHTTAKFFIIIFEGEEDQRCYALIDASRHGDLPEEVFGPREESGLYETTFKDTDCNTGREKLTKLIIKSID